MCSGAGKLARADLLGVGLDAAQHLRLDGREALDELRLEVVVDRQQVVQHEHLPVGARPGADADHRDLEVRHDRVGHLGGDRLEDDR